MHDNVIVKRDGCLLGKSKLRFYFFAVWRPKFIKLRLFMCGSDDSVQRRFPLENILRISQRYSPSSRQVARNRAKMSVFLDRQSCWGDFPKFSSLRFTRRFPKFLTVFFINLGHRRTCDKFW